MEAIIGHHDLQGLQRWGLGTDDAQGLYNKFGFRSLRKPQNIIKKVPLGDLEVSTPE